MIPFCEVPEALASARQAVAISIDDGFADAAENACPTLAAHGMTATLFVPPATSAGARAGCAARTASGRCSAGRRSSRWLRQGFEIGSHGRMHLAADVNPPEVVERDARASRIELEDRIGRAVRASPIHSATTRRRRWAVRAAGYRQACAVGDLPARADDDRWALPRLQVSTTRRRGGRADGDWRPSPSARIWAQLQAARLAARTPIGGWGPAEAGRLEGAVR